MAPYVEYINNFSIFIKFMVLMNITYSRRYRYSVGGFDRISLYIVRQQNRRQILWTRLFSSHFSYIFDVFKILYLVFHTVPS